MHTKVKLLGGCRCRLYSNYWGGYSQIIRGIDISIPPPGFGTPVGEKMKQKHTNVKETDLRETIIRLEAQNKALRHTLPSVRSKPMVLVQAQGYTTVSITHTLAFQSYRVSSV